MAINSRKLGSNYRTLTARFSVNGTNDPQVRDDRVANFARHRTLRKPPGIVEGGKLRVNQNRPRWMDKWAGGIPIVPNITAARNPTRSVSSPNKHYRSFVNRPTGWLSPSPPGWRSYPGEMKARRFWRRSPASSACRGPARLTRACAWSIDWTRRPAACY